MMTHTPWPRRPIGAILLSGQQGALLSLSEPVALAFVSCILARSAMIESKREMNASEIPSFVAEVIAAGCDINAVGH